jgi:EAL domain-containing protein (putative c-di-GMP-specific phosphodiesterase class I)
VAIDDFGTGYSALSYLKRFPIDVVKLDRSFIVGLDLDAADTEIVSAVVRLSAALGIKTVAEGVEEESQRQSLGAMGCSFVQGFLVARPMPAPDFLDFWVAGAARATKHSIAPAVPDVSAA